MDRYNIKKGVDIVMGQKDHLISLAKRPEEERQAIAIKGGIASGEARRKKRTLRQELQALLDLTEDGQTNREKMSLAILLEAKKGNTKAFEVIRDTIGEKPKDIVENINYTKEEVEKYKELTLEELKKLAGD